jgi:hypothetical protein
MGEDYLAQDVKLGRKIAGHMSQRLESSQVIQN